MHFLLLEYTEWRGGNGRLLSWIWLEGSVSPYTLFLTSGKQLLSPSSPYPRVTFLSTDNVVVVVTQLLLLHYCLFLPAAWPYGWQCRSSCRSTNFVLTKVSNGWTTKKFWINLIDFSDGLNFHLQQLKVFTCPLNYLSTSKMDWHKIVYTHSWSLADESWWLIFPLVP